MITNAETDTSGRTPTDIRGSTPTRVSAAGACSSLTCQRHNDSGPALHLGGAGPLRSPDGAWGLGRIIGILECAARWPSGLPETGSAASLLGFGVDPLDLIVSPPQHVQSVGKVHPRMREHDPGVVRTVERNRPRLPLVTRSLPTPRVARGGEAATAAIWIH